MKINNNYVIGSVAALMVCTIMSVVVLTVTRNMIDDSVQTLSTVNVNKLINDRQMQLRKKLEESASKGEDALKVAREEAMKESVEYATRLNIAMSLVAKECNCVVVRSDMILAGATNDITERAKALAEKGGVSDVTAR